MDKKFTETSFAIEKINLPSASPNLAKYIPIFLSDSNEKILDAGTCASAANSARCDNLDDPDSLVLVEPNQPDQPVEQDVNPVQPNQPDVNQDSEPNSKPAGGKPSGRKPNNGKPSSSKPSSDDDTDCTDETGEDSDENNSSNDSECNYLDDNDKVVNSDDEDAHLSGGENLKRKKKQRSCKRAKKKIKHVDAQIQSIMDELTNVNDTEEDLSAQMLRYLQELNWKNNLSDDDVKKLEPLYNKICEEISVMPKIGDILKLSMPYEEKCDIIEKILILYNAQPNTFEFLQLKRHLNKTVEKYKLFSMTELDYEKYKKIEDSLTVSEQEFKPLKYQILDSNMSNSNKSYIYQRYKYFSSLDSSNSEYNKLKQWLDVVLGIPSEMKIMQISSSDTNRKINKYLWHVKNRLDEDIFGLESVKEKILFLLNNRITNSNAKGLSFALCGPPGTAKTSIINTLSKAIDLPFFQINLGGAKDVSFLSGHGYTYEGAIPGVIVQALTTLKYKNGIIYFDEFDKISNSLHGMEISRMLLHITDFSQNDKFHDRYLSNGVDVDLSNIWFIYSLNDKELLDKTLSDRIPIIFVDGYDKHEKFQITQNYIIPKSLENINLSKKQILFADEAIRHIITLSEKGQDTSRKSGVRQVKHIVDNILMKINLLKTVSECKSNAKYRLKLSFGVANFKLPITITEEVIDCLKIDTVVEENLSYKYMYM